jgi:hypothetical protein
MHAYLICKQNFQSSDRVVSTLESEVNLAVVLVCYIPITLQPWQAFALLQEATVF